MRISEVIPEIRGKSDTLVVMLHAPLSCPENFQDVKKAVAEQNCDADLLVPRLPFNITSNVDPIALSIAVLEAIDNAELHRQERVGQGYLEIILIGHCAGALIARKVYLLARGQYDEATYNTKLEHRSWAEKVTRIIFLAGINRGWSIGKNLFWPRTAFFHFCLMVAALSNTGQFWQACRRGAFFITELRIQWLSMLKHSDRTPLTIQLLGTIDDVVTQNDDIDLQTGKDFVYLEVPNSGHRSIIDFKGEEGYVRKHIFQHALNASEQLLKQENELQIAPEHEIVEDIKNVTFIVHGIRDHGFWTNRVARRIQRTARKQGEKYITITSSYGYFPMWPFIFSYFKRQLNVRWLMDQYTAALAKYPNAKFSFVGHSNGTYLLASALKNYPSCRFERVLFLGSVVPTTFPWDQMIAQGRVKEVRNLVATNDWVVAIFPGVYEQLGLYDLGKSGSEGFRSDLPVDQQKWLSGTHNAGTKENNWQSIADFIVKGSSTPVPNLKPVSSLFVRILSKGAWICWLLLILILFGFFWLLLSSWPDIWKAASYWWLIPSAIYFYSVYYLLNRI